MKHVSSLAWIDFVNRHMSEEQMEQIKAHLASPCGLCAARVEMWRSVQRFARAEWAYQPPEDFVRQAKNLLQTTSARKQESENQDRARLLFEFEF